VIFAAISNETDLTSRIRGVGSRQRTASSINRTLLQKLKNYPQDRVRSNTFDQSGSFQGEVVDVIVVGPGGVRTAIWEKAKEADLSTNAGIEYGSSLEPFRTYMI
jgi:ribulose bisphosphate carboxylase small subunit